MKDERNNALNEQMENLHKEVMKIAQVMAQNHAIEQAINQKADVIGQALIRQKATAKAIQGNQDEQLQLIAECDNREKERQKEILEAIVEVAQSLADLGDTDVKKQILTESLERLSEEQESFMRENRDFSKKAMEDLEEVKKVLESMKQNAERMELSDQVRFINGKTEEMRKILSAYASKRSQITAAMAKQTQETKTQLVEIAQLMETQRERVDRIVTISSEYGEKTTQISEILEELLEEIRTVKASEETTPSLEDLFGKQPAKEKEPEEILDEEERILSVEDAEDTDDVEEADKEEKPAEETKQVPEQIFHDTEDDDLTFVDIDDEKEEPKKKKGFFSRLFGGR